MTLSFTAAPTLPSINDPANFESRASALFQWLVGTHISELEAVDGFYVQGQNVNIDGGTFYVNVSTNKIGMRTASPDHVLDIRPVTYASSQSGGVQLGATTGQIKAQWLLESNGGGSFFSRLYHSSDSSGGTECYLEAGNGLVKLRTDDADRVTILSTGEVGIGNTTPEVPLEVTGQAFFGGAFIANDAIVGINQTADEQAILIKQNHATQTAATVQIASKRAASSAYQFMSVYSGDYGDLEFRLSGDGNGTCDGSWTGGGADYAEYFEWADGNPTSEDRRGVSVVLVGDKVRPALAGESPFGVVSANPSAIGDGDIGRWKGKYLRDDYGAPVIEDYETVEWVETVPAVTERHPVVPPIIEGEPVQPITEWVTVEIEPAHEVPHSYAADAVPDGLTVPEDAVRTTLQRRKINASYDPDQPYIARDDRPEWVTVGLVGKLRMRKGQPVDPRWIKMRDVSETVEEWLIR